MASRVLRILLLADTHLGIDLPAKPRVVRRRRGLDFLENFERVLRDAIDSRVDCVVHGGDLFFRSRIPASLVQSVFMPIKRVADTGIPVFIVPGNHERSKIPYDMLALHPAIHIFDRPRTFVEYMNGLKVALAGFPYCRDNVRGNFRQLLGETEWEVASADVNLLCVHQCFEGAKVGAHDFTFRNGTDVVKCADVPSGFAAVPTGHVHRFQVLTSDLGGDLLQSPIFYPGSIERTSFAERDEEKGYLILDVGEGDSVGGKVLSWEFRRLPARPMLVEELDANNADCLEIETMVSELLGHLPPDAVVQLRVGGIPQDEALTVLGAKHLRSLAPATMNVSAVLVDERTAKNLHAQKHR